LRRKSRPKEPSLLFKSCAQVATVGKYIEAYFEDKIWWVGRIIEIRVNGVRSWGLGSSGGRGRGPGTGVAICRGPGAEDPICRAPRGRCIIPWDPTPWACLPAGLEIQDLHRRPVEGVTKISERLRVKTATVSV